MLLKRLYDETLAQASYLVGCQATGEALVVDPNRDADQYVRAAADEELEIRRVTETHIHADFVSGTRELAARTGAEILLSGHGGEEWRYRFADSVGARVLRDGETFQVGRVSLRVLHTPGHTPEHLSFVLTDGAASDRPMGVFTGDFLFVGDVGRPDLLEKAAGVEGAMAEGARELFGSLRRFRELPDYLQIWPGHGAGSACGRSLGAVPSSTLGYEKLVNWAFQVDSEEEFAARVLEGQPEPPRYFGRMKTVNRDGPPLLGAMPRPPGLDPERLPELLGEGATVVDLRPRDRFQAGHVPGTLSLPLDSSFTNWAGWLLPYDRDLYLLEEGDGSASRRAARLLALVGLDRVAGWFGADAFERWSAGGRELETAVALGPGEADEARKSGPVTFVDVRSRSEWEEGHIPGARHLHLGHLQDHLDQIPQDGPVVLYCRTGARSNIGQSLLLARGRSRAANLEGGLVGWRGEGRETVGGP